MKGGSCRQRLKRRGRERWAQISMRVIWARTASPHQIRSLFATARTPDPWQIWFLVPQCVCSSSSSSSSSSQSAITIHRSSVGLCSSSSSSNSSSSKSPRCVEFCIVVAVIRARRAKWTLLTHELMSIMKSWGKVTTKQPDSPVSCPSCSL